jgi:hypothetical protein
MMDASTMNVTIVEDNINVTFTTQQGIPGPQGPAGSGQLLNGTLGDGTNTTYTITHNFNTRSISVTIWRNSTPFDEIVASVGNAQLNSVDISFALPPSNNQFAYRITG